MSLMSVWLDSRVWGMCWKLRELLVELFCFLVYGLSCQTCELRQELYHWATLPAPFCVFCLIFWDRVSLCSFVDCVFLLLAEVPTQGLVWHILNKLLKRKMLAWTGGLLFCFLLFFWNLTFSQRCLLILERIKGFFFSGYRLFQLNSQMSKVS